MTEPSPVLNLEEMMSDHDDLLEKIELRLKNEKKWKKIRERFPNHENFFDKKIDYFNDEGGWIHFNGFSLENEQIECIVGKSGETGKRQDFSFQEFDEILEKFKSQEQLESDKRAGLNLGKPEDRQEYIDRHFPGTKTKIPGPHEMAKREAMNKFKSDLELAEEAEAEEKSGKAIEKIKEPEITEEKKVERVEEEDLEIKKLEDEVAEKRRLYAKKEYEMSGVLASIKKVIPFLKFDTSQESSFKTRREEYQNALRALMEYRVGKIKGLDGEKEKKEVENLIKYYNQDEKINLYEAHTEAKARSWEEKLGKPGGWVVKGAKKFFNWYANREKKSFWEKAKGITQKGIFNGSLTAAGFAVSYFTPVGGLAAAGAKSVLGGAVAGIGAARMAEGRYRRKENKKLEENQARIIKDMEKPENAEEKYKILRDHLILEIENYDKNLKTEKRKIFWRKMFGGFVGGLAGAVGLGRAFGWTQDLANLGIGREIIQKAGEKISGGIEWGKELYRGSFVEKLDKMVGIDIDESSEIKNYSKEILKGSENKLKKWKDINYLKQIKDNWLNDADLIENNPREVEKMREIMIQDYPGERGKRRWEKLSNITEKLSDSDQLNFQTPAVEESPEEIKSKIDKLKEKIQKNYSHPETPAEEVSPKAVPNIPKKGDGGFGNLPDLFGDNKSSDLEGLAVGAGIGAAAALAKSGDVIIDLGKEKKRRENRKNENSLDFEPDDNENIRAIRIMRALSLDKNENYRIIKGEKYEALKDKLPQKLLKNVEKIKEELVEKYGNEAEPAKEETMLTWIARLAKLSVEREKTDAMKEAA